ncbi:hypothetical protein OAK70_02420 [Akkermansiaceae bacterium]|nr:hypothetical protein [Akkermansiaceae bacterium]MDC0271031.1 hypothetical protein [Akkermansiaceae bacterium]
MIITENIAEQFLKDNDSVDLQPFTSIDDAAAESLSKYKGVLWLDGLTELSDAAFETLSKHDGGLGLDHKHDVDSIDDQFIKLFAKVAKPALVEEHYFTDGLKKGALPCEIELSSLCCDVSDEGDALMLPILNWRILNSSKNTLGKHLPSSI